MKVKIKPVDNKDNFMPIKGSDFAACYDVKARKIEVQPDGMVICRLGFSSEIEEGFKGVLAARSNITKHSWVLANGIGKIDSDFRLEWEARFRPIPTLKNNKWNNTVGKLFKALRIWETTEFPYKVGERVAQIYFESLLQVEFKEVFELEESKREGGFGSTGLK